MYKRQTLEEDEYSTDTLEVKNVNGEYVVRNKGLKRMISMTNLENEEALIYLRNKLKKMGIGDKLKKMGIPEGSTTVSYTHLDVYKRQSRKIPINQI